jgi:NADH-quinone oxidoreductase subunit N
MTGALDLRPLVPALIVVGAALLVLLAQAFTPRGRRTPAFEITLTGLALALGATWLLPSRPTCTACGLSTGGSVVFDSYVAFMTILLLASASVAALLSRAYLEALNLDRGEPYALLLFSLVGLIGLVSAVELVSLFVALEIASIALYALTGLRRKKAASSEAALKYFLTGAFSSAFLLFGIALLYGATGSTSMVRIAAQLSTGPSPLVWPAVALITVGLGFKVAVAPFHMWVADVYEGAPTNVTAFMSAAVKIAAFGALLQLSARALGEPLLQARWRPAIAALAIVTMIVGNLLALAQTRLKRLLAYSSVAHAGYVLTALVATPKVAAEAILFYLVGYAAVSLGAFGILAALAEREAEPCELADLAGLAERRPALAFTFTVFLVSLTGIPATAGFVGKFHVFSAAVGAGYALLAVTGAIMSVVSAYYYLRVVVVMYMHESARETSWRPIAPPARLALVACVLAVIILGVFPGYVLALARSAAAALP